MYTWAQKKDKLITNFYLTCQKSIYEIQLKQSYKEVTYQHCNKRS